jgi:hypothetical protein
LPILGGNNQDLVGALGTATILTWGIMACLGFLVLIGLAVMIPGIYIQYIRTNEFAALFKVGEVFGIVKDNIADILMSIVASIGANLLISVVSRVISITICGPFILALVAPVWLNISLGHLYGQIAAKDKMAGAM